MSRNRRRQVANVISRGFMYLFAGVALLPLALVLIYVVIQGMPALMHVEFFFNAQRPEGIPGGGIANAFAGTIVMVGIASVLAIPVGIVSGVQLVEYGHGRLADGVRLACDVLVSIPSIVIGLFIYSLLVVAFHGQTGFFGALALAILMLPVVVRTTTGSISTARATAPKRPVAPWNGTTRTV